MSKTAIIVIVFSSILLVCLIGVGILVGVGYANSDGDGNFGFSDIFGSGIDINESEDLNLDDVSTLVVDCVSGDIDVIQSSKARVTLIGNIWPSQKESEYLKVYKDGDTLTVKFDAKSKPFGFMSTDIDMTVYLPSDSNLTVKVISASGDVEVSGLDFEDLSVNSTSGSTTVSNCKGNGLSLDKSSGDTNVENAEFKTLSIDSTSGDIEVVNTPADIILDSTSGNTDLSDISGSVDLRSTSGRVSVSVDGTNPEAININSTSGDVRVYMDSGAEFELSAKATSGNINTDFEITVKGTGNDFSKSIDGKSGNGGNFISIRTISGDIDLIKK